MALKTTVSFSKNEILQSFEVLDRLWKRDILPENLERHYFLYWFVLHEGNIVRTAEALQIHRNTIQFHFLRFGFAQKAVRLRRFWRELAQTNPKAAFETHFLDFYHRYDAKTKMSLNENKLLIRLWRTGFSFKTLGAHYMLWAVRNGRPREWFEKKLGYSDRHCLRILVSCLDPRTPNGFWLAPLKPVPEEIYTPRYQNGYLKTKSRARRPAVPV